jgi:membrane associated rhomboid family serine protease
VYYALAFPQARLGFLLGFGWRIRWLRIPAWVVLIGWVLVQLLGAAQQVSGFTNVSALGHLGGAAVGFVFWLVSAAWARSDRAREPGIPAAEPPVAIPPERERQLAFVLIGVAVLALVLTRRLELGVGFALLFLAAQVLYCYRFNLMVDWAWSLGAGLLGFVYLFFRGLRWDRALVVASAISGAMVGYRALRDWNRPLLED